MLSLTPANGMSIAAADALQIGLAGTHVRPRPNSASSSSIIGCSPGKGSRILAAS